MMAYPSVFEIRNDQEAFLHLKCEQEGLDFKSDPLNGDLTGLDNVDNITPLSVGKLSGFSTPLQGQKLTAPLAVFLCLSFRAAFVRFYSVMVDCLEPLSSGPRLVAVLRTPFNPPPNYSQLLRSGLTTFTRFKPMKTKSHRAKSAQNPTALFSVFYHRQLIASGLPGAVALRLKSYYPACNEVLDSEGVEL